MPWGHVQKQIPSALSQCSWSQESYLSCVYIPLTLIGAIFSVLAALKQVRKKGKEVRHCGQVENKEFSQQ